MADINEFLFKMGLSKNQKKWTSMEDVKNKAISLWNKDKLYVILSLNSANLQNNTSVPYIVNVNPKCLWIFEDYDKAKKFIDKYNRKLNGKYPIGIIDKDKIIYSLKTTLSIAYALHIPDVEFNPEEYDCIHFDIREFFAINGQQLINNFSALVPEKNADGSENIYLTFNPFSFDKNE